MKKKLKYNLIWFIPLLILNGISLLNMINAPLISSLYTHALIKQVIWFLLGFGIILLAKFVKIKYLFKYSFFFYLFSVFLLILVLIMGRDINGAKCWFTIGPINFQPSELMKVALTLFSIQIVINSPKATFKNQLMLILKLLIITIIPSILVFLEPDTGAIINYLIIIFVVFIFAKLNKWWYIIFFTTFFLGIFIFFYAYFFHQDILIQLLGSSLFYRMDRIINFANGIGYQLESALITIGSSSFFRFNLKKIVLYIPEAPTDFIFAFTIGNFGIFGGILIIICYVIINFYLVEQAYKLKNNSHKLFIYAYLSILIFHQVYNIFMNIGLLPIMGIPLPFISYGGTNTLINFLFLGLSLKMINIKDY